MTLNRIAIVSCSALISLMLAAALLIRSDDGPFHIFETAATPTVEVSGLPGPSVSAAGPERADLDRLAKTTLVLLLLSAVTALVTLAGVIGSENLALRGRRAIEVMLGAPPRRLAAVAARLWRGRLLAAGAAGGVLCAVAFAWLVRTAPPGTELAAPSPWPTPVVLASIALLVLVAGVAPVYNLYRPGRSLSAEADRQQYTDPRPQQFNRVLLVTFQLTIAIAILAGSGLLILSSDRAFTLAEGGQTVLGRLSAQGNAADDSTAHAAIYRQALAALGDAPGVAAESLATPGAWIGRGPSTIAVNHCGPCMAGGMPNPIHRARVRVHSVMPGFFAKRGMQILAGSGFAETAGAAPSDTEVPERSVVINEAYARAHFIDPVGRSLTLPGDAEEVWYEVVGVVRDTPRGGLGDSGSRYAVYYSASEHPPASIELVATVDLPPSAGLDDSLRVVREALDGTGAGDIVITDFRRAEEELARIWGTAGWMGGGTRAAGGLAALVALAGVMSTLRAHIRARLREMGIRSALGASPRSLRRLIIRETLRIAAAGTGLGLWVATLVVAFLSPRAVDIFSAPLFLTIAILFVGGAVTVALPSATLAATAQPRAVMEAQNRVR